MKINEIQELIKFVSKSGVSEVELETKDIKITIKTGGKGNNGNSNAPIVVQALPSAVPAATPVVSPQVVEKVPVKAEAPAADTSKYITVKSPMVGTFYRSPGPEKGPFVNVGDEVKSGKVICIIEAMKLFNEIESEVSGKIVKVLVDDATPVEYDQPLFLVEPN